MTAFAFLFPGQGSQSVGMLDAWGDHPAVRETLVDASAALGEDVAKLIREGPAETLGLTGEETFSFTGITELNDGRTPRTVRVTAGDVEFDAVVRIDTPGEANYYRNGGIMPYVLRNLLRG